MRQKLYLNDGEENCRYCPYNLPDIIIVNVVSGQQCACNTVNL